MNEWLLLLYPIVLFAYLMLAARWQPKHEPGRVDASRRPRDRRGH